MFRKFMLNVSLVLVSGVILATCGPDRSAEAALLKAEESQHQKKCGVSKEVKSSSLTIDNTNDAPAGTFPWHAGLYYSTTKDGKIYWQQRCGGTLISDRLVLTAAYCVADIKDPSSLRVALGKYYLYWDSEEPIQEKHNVSSVSISRDYNKATYSFDIAVVVLSEKVKFSEHIMPVCLDSNTESNHLQNGSLYVVGWRVGEQSNDSLRYTTVTALPEDECHKELPTFINKMEKICIAKNNPEMTVIGAGDGGGGLTAVHTDGLHYLVGISDLKIKNISTFTNIKWPTHVLWIDNQMKNLN